MEQESLHAIAAERQIRTGSLRATPIEEGFTGATKYLIETESGTEPRILFCKLVETNNTKDAATIQAEVVAYEILTELHLTGVYFPVYRGNVRTSSEHALLIDYLPNVSWGGPWNRDNIEKLHRSIVAGHNTQMSSQAAADIIQTSSTLNETLQNESAASFDGKEKDALFREAWNMEKSLVNSRGMKYFSAAPGSIDALLKAEADFDKDSPSRLILRDINFGNIAIGHDRVYFVDPVYIGLGNPNRDLIVLGVNITRTFSSENQDNTELQKRVQQLFFKDKAALAFLTKYWVACTSLPYEGRTNAQIPGWTSSKAVL